ncbi:MAG: hypothetical protein HYX42_12280 [Polaromonas sp.]|uniref:beta strand repeat-containing protein n=1 Tax=Polaromonas sp. TaxID=1869339 RepID=UPI0025CDF0C5|nr:hypothetical protein [Polaromonas sp.]MBI2727014.1 hypothetical protein [Polaromonas sp.]
MWGIVTTAGAAPTRLGFFNNSAGTAPKFTTLSFTTLSGGTQANALAGDPATGILYYFDRTALTVNSVNLNTQVTATVGTIAPASPDGNGAMIGAVVDANSNLIMMTSAGAGNTAYHIAIVNKAGNTTAARWQTVTYTAGLGGGLPFSGGSGDIYIDQSGQLRIATNSNPTAVYPIALTIVNGSITSALASASTTYTTGGISVAGASVDPASGLSYYGGAQTGQILYQFDPTTSGTQVLLDSTPSTTYTTSDMGNCVLQPAAPTITKTFANTFESGGVGNTTTTLTITFGNSNTAPIYLMQPFSDVFPAGMRVFNTVTFTSTCNTSVPSATITVNSTSMTWAAGGRIQAGGCSISFPVTATAAVTPYVNTVAAGALVTTSGSNALPAQATLTVGTDFSVTKQVRPGTTDPLTNTATLGVLQTMQYVLTITNSASGGTGSATFTDTFPTLITPVLSITAVQAGGGSCTTATAVVGGRTRLTGTMGYAPAGATCTVTVTALGSSTTGTFVNTVTIAAVSSTVDIDATDNNATATVTLSPIANITISKTNGLGGTVRAGQTVVYTVTVANLGPSAAVPSYLLDPGGVPGLSCTNVTCAATGVGATCPGAGSTTIAYLQGNAGAGQGIQLNTFSQNQTLTFAVTCGVTATGLP